MDNYFKWLTMKYCSNAHSIVNKTKEVEVLDLPIWVLFFQVLPSGLIRLNPARPMSGQVKWGTQLVNKRGLGNYIYLL